MAKIELDKYYTPENIAKYIVVKTNEVIGSENITCYLETSAGDGAFLKHLDKPFIAMDIQPEGENITKGDYLKTPIPYVKGRCVIGNPPFGDTGTSLYGNFFNKSVTECDYISWVLPVSQFDNDVSLFKFDLVHSEVLPMSSYSGVELLCTFNIYKRPAKGLNKKAKNHVLKSVCILGYQRGSTISAPFYFDYCMCMWGAAAGTECVTNKYADSAWFLITNQKLKVEIMNVLKNTDWKSLHPSISTPRLLKWRIYKHLKETIPGIY